MRSLTVVLCVMLAACANTATRSSSHAEGAPIPMIGSVDSAVYRAALLVALSPRASSGQVAVATRQLAGDPLSPSVSFDLGKPSAPSVADRAVVLRSLGLAATNDIGWAGCPASTARSADRSACPATRTVRYAVGAPGRYPRDARLGRLQSVLCEATGSPECWMVRVIETSLAPDGAQSRTEFLYFQQRDGKWILADRKQGTTLE